MTRPWDAIVIGSGISSLTCALFLARAGRRVCVVERQRQVGGYLHCFARYGHRFETGAHYAGALGEGEPFRVLLDHLGVYRDDLFVPLAADGFDVLQFRDFRTSIPRGYDQVTAALSDEFPKDAAAVRQYFAVVRRAATTFSTYNFARLHQDDDEIGRLLTTPLKQVVTALTSNPRLQCVFYAYCALHGVAPADVSIGLHALVTDSLVRGAWGFRHGGEHLAQRYVDALQDLGGELIRGVGVAELRTVGRRVTDVVLDDGQVIQGTVVISGIHPKATFRLLSGFRPSPAFTDRLGNTQETIGFLGIYGLCREPAPLARDRNYYLFDWSEPEAFERLCRVPEEAEAEAATPRAAFLCRPDRVAPEVRSDHYPLSIHSQTRFPPFAPWQGLAGGRKPRAYYERKLRLAEDSLTLVEHYLPGFRASLVKYDVSTPLSNLRFNGSEEGSGYGIYHAMKNTGARGLGPRTQVDNLLLTGQSSLFPGLLGAAVSGLRTAGNLIGMKNILRDLSPMVRL